MLVIAFMGALSVSLVCLLVDRLMTHERVSTSHSYCACGRALRLYEVIPVLGWIAALGRTRCCGTRIPARYPALELAAGLSWAILSTLPITVVWPLYPQILLLAGLVEFIAVSNPSPRAHGGEQASNRKRPT